MQTTHHRLFIGLTLALVCGFFAPLAQARPPRARELAVTVQTIQMESRTLVVVAPTENSPREFVWTKITEFFADSHPTTATALKAGMKVTVYYHTPFLGKPYVSRVVWQTETPSVDKNSS
jgi:hypothetical protein